MSENRWKLWIKIWRILIWIFSQVNFSCRCNFCLFNSWWIHRWSIHKRFIHSFARYDWIFWRVKRVCSMLCWYAETHRNHQRRHKLTKHSEPETTYEKTSDKLSNLKLCVFDWRPKNIDVDCGFCFLLLSLAMLPQIQTKRNSLPNHGRRQKNSFNCLKVIKKLNFFINLKFLSTIHILLTILGQKNDPHWRTRKIFCIFWWFENCLTEAQNFLFSLFHENKCLLQFTIY